MQDFRDGKISAGKIKQDYGIDISADAKTPASLEDVPHS
jgi:hypothetical protein